MRAGERDREASAVAFWIVNKVPCVDAQIRATRASGIVPSDWRSPTPALANGMSRRRRDLVSSAYPGPKVSVIPAGLEPATYALGKRRSDPAELWDRTAQNLPERSPVRKPMARRRADPDEFIRCN